MKTRVVLFITAFAAITMVSCRLIRNDGGDRNQTGSNGQKERNSFEWLAERFREPGKEFGSAPLWVWNTEVTEEIIDSTMLGFKENAFGGVFIHPRPGLITAYLSDEWFRLVEHTLEKGRELGLNVWIYDENSYPSGFAGGHVPDQMPESYKQGQMLHLTKTTLLPPDAEKFYLVLSKTGDGFENITGKLGPYRGRKGNFYLFGKENYRRSPWYGGFSYVDLLVEGVTEKFIEVTMDGYEQVAGGEFGGLVPGIFTDEPNIEVQGEGNIRWTPDLFEVFFQKWGYDLRLHLPALFEETGNWKKVRHNYYQTLLQLFIDRWSKPWQAYTEKKGLEWTGHYWEHGWPNPNHGGDNMAMYAWHQRPAIDMLFNQFNEDSPNAQFGNIRAVRELSSVANQLGKKRTLSETYGGGGWELTFMDMKRLGDWEYVLGVNTMNQHLSFMTIMGARKYDYPPSFSYHSPWWPYYGTLNRYFARLSLALSTGEQVNEILVLEPTTSAWMYAAYGKAHPRMQEIGEEFQTFITTLERAQVAYDLGSENIIKDHGDVKEGKFIIGKRAYSTVVLPPGMENIDSTTFALLEKYAAGGGKLFSFEELRYIDGGASEKLSGLAKHADGELIASRFSSLPLSFPEADGGKLYHQRRELNGGQLLFLVNSDMDESSRGQVRIGGKDAVLMDPVTGNIYDYPEVRESDSVLLEFDIPPAGSRLLFIGNRPIEGYPAYVPPVAAGNAVDASPSSIERLRPNMLTIDFCDLSLGGASLKDLNVYDAADTVFKYHGFKDGNPWNTSVQFEKSTVERDTFSAGTGFSATYHFNIKEGATLRGLQAAVERPGLWTVELNGKELRPREGEWWLDKAFALFDISGAARTGSNELVLKASPMSVHAEIEPVYILGDFGLQPAAKGFELVKEEPMQLGSWKDQGAPLYGHEVAYTRSFTAHPGEKYLVKLGDWSGTVASVRVNGREAGIIFSPPFVLDISAHLQDGENEVQVIVTGSLKNTLGPHHNDPDPGLVSPWHFREVKEYPPGNRYDLYDYGLMEDFQIISR